MSKDIKIEDGNLPGKNKQPTFTKAEQDRIAKLKKEREERIQAKALEVVKKLTKEEEDKQKEIEKSKKNPYHNLTGTSYLNARIKRNDNIYPIHYANAYINVRGYVATFSVNFVDYSFFAGKETMILKEHKQVVLNWLNEAHRVEGADITNNPAELAASEFIDK